MADKPKTVKGTLLGVPVETSEENAERLGAQFEAAKSSKSTSSKSK